MSVLLITFNITNQNIHFQNFSTAMICKERLLSPTHTLATTKHCCKTQRTHMKNLYIELRVPSNKPHIPVKFISSTLRQPIVLTIYLI